MRTDDKRVSRAGYPKAGEVKQLHDAIDRACRIIEAADARNLPSDGPLGFLPPQMTLKEWGELYDVLDKARKGKR